jgi:hypothetical protein
MAAARPRTQLLLAVIGAVFATLVTGAFGTSQWGRLAGAALGAAIPVLVVSGGAQGLALSTAITGGALFITYGGFTLFDYAGDQKATFPIPAAMPNPAEGGGGSPTTTTTANGLSLEVSPASVHCDAESCDEVAVKSTGVKALTIWLIEFEGDVNAEFGHSGDCDNNTLQTGEECHVSVIFTPSGVSGTRVAKLVIHQNLPGDPTRVPIEAEAEGPTSPPPPTVHTDLIPVRANTRCVYQRGGATNGQDALQILFVLQLEGASSSETPAVLVQAQSNLGPSTSNVGRPGPGYRAMALPLDPNHYGRTHAVTVRVDPENEVPETNEGNNQFLVRVFVPPHPASTQTLVCK